MCVTNASTQRKSKCTVMLSHLIVTLMEAEAVALKGITEKPCLAGNCGTYKVSRHAGSVHHSLPTANVLAGKS